MSEPSRAVPSEWATLATIASLTLRRLWRGRMQWVCLVIACLPILFAVVAGEARSAAFDWTGIVVIIFTIELLVLALLPAFLVASSIGDEIEDRTTTYLWSRPVARWTVLIGKLVALAPIAVLFVVGSWIVACELGPHQMPSMTSTLGLATGALALCMVAAGISTLVPKHGMALTIVYMLLFDLPIGQIPASLQILSITHQASLIARVGFDLGADASRIAPIITITMIGGLWLAVGLWRIRRLES